MKFLQCTQLRMDRFVPALDRTNSPGGTRIIRHGFGSIVFTFPAGLTDRMNRREIKYVKTHSGYIGQPSLTIFERSVFSAFFSA